MALNVMNSQRETMRDLLRTRKNRLSNGEAILVRNVINGDTIPRDEARDLIDKMNGPAPKRVAKSLVKASKSDVVAADSVEVASHSALIARVPDKSVAKAYVGRKLSLGGRKKIDDLDLLDYAFKSGQNVLIEGPTGPGKTMFSRAWAASRNKIMARVSSNVGIDKTALFGGYKPDPVTGNFVWKDGAVTHVVRNGGIILINEVNFIPERVGTILFGLLDGNREIVLDDKDGEIVRAHKPDNCWCSLSDKECEKRWVLIVADMNPDYLGTRGLNAAFRNRWQLQLAWGYDSTVEKKLIKSDHLRIMADQIRVQVEKGAIETPVSTNMLMEFEKIASDLSVDFAISNFVTHFASDERQPVKLVCDTHKDNIDNDLSAPEQIDEELVEDDPENLLDEDENEWLYS